MASVALGGAPFGPGFSSPTAPTLTAPADFSALFIGESVTFSATTTDNDLDRIDFVINRTGPGTGGTIVATDSSSPYSVGGVIALAAGVHTLVARAVRGGQVTDSVEIDLTVHDIAFSDTIYWLDADATTNSGDGTAVTAATDQGAGTPNTIVAATGGGPTYYATRFNDGACLRVDVSTGSGNKGLKSTGSPAVAAFLSGSAVASKEFTVVTVCQPRHFNGVLFWAWGRAAVGGFTDGITCRANTNAYKPQVYGVSTTLDAPSTWEHPVPMIFTTRRSGGGTPVIVYRQDGVNQTPVSWTWTGTWNVDTFGVGCHVNSTELFASEMYITDMIVYNRALSDAEVANVEAYLAARRGFKHKIAAEPASEWLVIAMLGQSNMVGYGTNTPDDYAIVADPDAFYMGVDGFVKPIIMDTGDGVNDAAPTIAFATPTAASMVEAVRARMRANGETRKLLFVPCAINSSTAASWATSLTTTPPPIGTLIGYAKHRISDALKAPNSKLVVFIDQGEANCGSAADATDWGVKWTLICDELNTYYSGRFDKTTHFVFGRLSLVIGGVGAFAANVRAAEDALDLARSDSILVQRPDGSDGGTPSLHLIGTEQEVYGILMANAWEAAS